MHVTGEMEKQQSTSSARPAKRRGGLDNYDYVLDYTPRQKVSSKMGEENIITGGRRKTKRTPLFMKGESDFPRLDEYKQRRHKKVKQNAPAGQEKISVIIPSSSGAQLDSDSSCLTELEDLEDALNDAASDGQPQDRELEFKGKSHDANRQSNTDHTALHGLPEAEKCVACAGKIINLRQQTQQLLASKVSETKILENENNRLKAELARLRASQTAASSTRIASQGQSPQDQLQRSRNEVERLRRRLSSAQEFGELIRPLPLCDDAMVASTGFVHKEMDTLSDYVVYTADILCNVRNKDEDTRNHQMLDQALLQLVDQTLPSTEILSSDPISAFRALLFGFIRERIFYDPGIWRDLHFDGIMLRQYQQIVEESISPGSLERYHRAALKLTLTKSTEFHDVFMPGYNQQLEFELLRLLAPFIQTEDANRHLRRQLRTLFGHAIQLRARCYPHKGTRYQLVQFPPGQMYDSRIMRAEDSVGATIPVPDDGQMRRIKVCMHGLMRAHSVQETTSGLSLIDELSQPFLLDSETDGQLVSYKAAVILE
ncbi:hypothetical protein BDW62DRAFT_200117 [Aspergillus aurantiobrunneus]